MKRIHSVLIEYFTSSLIWVLGILVLMTSFFIFGAASYSHLYRPEITPSFETIDTYNNPQGAEEFVIVMPRHHTTLKIVDYLNENIQKVIWYQFVAALTSLILLEIGARGIYKNLPTMRKEKRRILADIKNRKVEDFIE